jgi:hypothetical protein
MDEIIARRMKEDPIFRAETLALRQKQSEEVVGRILEQRHWCRFAMFYITRNECKVSIRWEFHESMENPKDWSVLGCIREMSLIPSPLYGMDRIIVRTYGNGSIELDLGEGRSYYFEFYIDKDEQIGKRPVAEFLRDFSDAVVFQVSVPLSDAHKDLLKTLDRSPEEAVEHRVGQFLKIEEVFDAQLKKGIEEIKSKNLSPEDEEERISRLVDLVASLRERSGQ